MNDFENRILKGSGHRGMIKYWASYVGDILNVWPGTDKQIDQFVEETNAMHKDFKFTAEKGNKTINYLDFILLQNLQDTNS